MNLSLIKVPLDYASGETGSSLGPDAICNCFLTARLSSAGYNVKVLNSLVEEIITGKIENSKAKYISSVAKSNENLAKIVENQLKAGDKTIVIGGDHSIFMGSIAGVTSAAKDKGAQVGVIYIDAHADFNTVDTTPSGNIHGMPLAASCGIGTRELTDIYFKGEKLSVKNVVIIGARDIDPDENKLLKSYGVKVYRSMDVEKKGIYNIVTDVVKDLSSRCDWIHLSFDVDSVDPVYAPGTNLLIPGGLTYREIKTTMNILNECKLVRSVDIVEYNPLKDNNGITKSMCQDLILTLFGSC